MEKIEIIKRVDKIINNVITKFKREPKIFTSEKDFQLKFAWAIKEENEPDLNISLEYYPRMLEITYINNKKEKKSKKIHIDILIEYNNVLFPIELKYKTKRFISENNDYELKAQGAQDQGRCNFLWDVSRLENFKKSIEESDERKFGRGYAIFLTNDFSYLKENEAPTSDKDFRLYDGRIINKDTSLKWRDGTKPGTIGSCPFEIKFDNTYKLKWNPYQDDDCNGISEFTYLMIEVR